MDFGAAINPFEQTVEGLLAWPHDYPKPARLSHAVSGLAAGPAADQPPALGKEPRCHP